MKKPSSSQQKTPSILLLHPTSILRQSAELQRVHAAKMGAKTLPFGTNLLKLFNRSPAPVDHVKQTASHTYVPVFAPKMATHQLIGTLWRKDRERKQDIMEHGFALAVVAKPLRPQLKLSQLEIKRVIPEDAPIFRVDGPLIGKRGVLRWLARAIIHDPDDVEGNYTYQKMCIAIDQLDEAGCVHMYQEMRRASLVLRLT